MTPMSLYAATIFLSAFLLFQVQPLIAKIILPWFGGSAAVWSAALLFFQVSLLAGYAYAHGSIRYLNAKGQVAVHVGLLAVSCALLPILPSPGWKPSQAGDPTLRILALLAATIGLPYFLLSATSPLLQAWFARRSGSAMPYRLFALSNFGSMLGLVSFPFLVEPALTSRQQALMWSGAYVLFVLLCAAAAWASRTNSPAASAVEVAAAGPAPRFRQLLLWIGLAACASTLLVAVTNHLSQNVAPIPLLWVVPLATYLTTFILAFESDRAYRRWIFLPFLAPVLWLMAYLIYANSGNSPIELTIPAFAFGLFICCMVCHGELARSRPAPRYLTLFYLMVSLGGALGGLFVALIAPRVFDSYLELPVGLVACASLAAIVLWNIQSPKLQSGLLRPPASSGVTWPLRLALVIAVGVLAGYLVRQERLNDSGHRLMARNFYGVLRVTDDEDSANRYAERALYHGTIKHGSQLLNEDLRYRATTYYAPSSGVGRVLRALQSRGPIRVGVIGLGAGVLSSYGRAGDVYSFYDINPFVAEIAQTEFSFLAHSAAAKRILLGDARLVLERQASQQFDLLAVDAFSGDAIPVHLLTREGVALYFRHLKPNGILALHVSNRYLDLVPVGAAAAKEFGKQAVVVWDDGDAVRYLSDNTWVLVSSETEWLRSPSFETANVTPAVAWPGFRPWTDNYSNVVQILKLFGRGTSAPRPTWPVIAGQSIGPIRLDEGIQGIAAVLGPEISRGGPSEGEVAYRWFAPPKNAGLGVRATANGEVRSIWVLNDGRYVTREGLHAGSTEAQVRAALGDPSKVTTDSAAGVKILNYEGIGEWFSIQLDARYRYYQTVFEIGVKRVRP
jgi:SAM-dependent methyltransferase